MWCSAFFGADNIPSFHHPNPPSSSPEGIYETLLKDVANNDRRSEKIRLNKAGLRRGANSRHSQGVINDFQRLEILDKVRLAQISDFKPLLYVIPYSLVSGLLSTVPVKHRANPLSEEYIITRLPRSSFDIINP
ncbi:MAG: hypothetical protein QOE77_1017 [Blastocatellia bacterium]|nr:hypothetical protein [Blastocatellia bacterium]